MRIVGALRVKNEARWIKRSIESILPICERVHIFDDNSTDDTLDILHSLPNVIVKQSEWAGSTDEVRDKNALLDQVDKYGGADWLIHIDGDEVLAGEPKDLHDAISLTLHACLSLPVLYLWDREDQIRVDGVYGDFMRESAFRYSRERFRRTGAGVNFHCGNVPMQLRADRGYVKAPLLHFGYLNREDRIRKYEWYNRLDPNNKTEDYYRHMVIGDVFPTDSKFTHGGPLELRPL